jgi:glycosyltransferase involved in cell wall biosynthesis
VHRSGRCLALRAGLDGTVAAPQENGVPVDSSVNQPFISVVTPFHNTVAYLAQCIESVLAQTHQNFEYVLVDNCSTDGSENIARSYADRDSRIRLIRRPQLLSQVQNYNRALAEISNASEYCKIVQADDFIFPDCLALMVQSMQQSESIGLVSSYWLKGDEVRGSAFPHSLSMLSGREVARMYLQRSLWVFGSPTAVLYRSALVKQNRPFYDETQLHEDTDKCLEILKEWDFGFVHQVLSFSRADNESISSAVRAFRPTSLDHYILIRRYARVFLDSGAAAVLQRKSKRDYYIALAQAALRFRDRNFWDYHRRGLRTIGEKISWPRLTLHVGLRLLWLAANPGATLLRAFRLGKSGPREAPGSAASAVAAGVEIEGVRSARSQAAGVSAHPPACQP